MKKRTSYRQSALPTAANASNLTTKKTWNNIEAEMLMKVLAYLHSPTNPKEMASRRLVCKHWRDVIDEHFEFWLTVNETKFDMSTVSHLRVKNCTVVSLAKELDPEKQAFKSPKSLLKLSIWGETAANNFHLLLEQAVNLKQLSLNWKALTTPGFMDTPPPKQEERFQEFWSGLNTLEISLDSNPQPTSLTDNLCKMLSRNMQGLSTLKMRIGFREADWERFITALYSFFGNQTSPNLKTFHFFWFFEFVTIPPPQSSPRFLGDNQFESLRLSLIGDLVPFWIPVIQAQRKLKDFRLTFRMDFCDRFREPNQLCQVLRSTLPLNQDTLTTVELSKFNFAAEFDARIFQNMEKLTRLVLRPCQFQGSYQKILNLGVLPDSIETLVLGKVSVDSEELRLLVDRLEKIKVLELIGTQIRGEFVMKEIFEILTKKEKICKITVNPLDEKVIDCVQTISKYGKQFLLVNGHEMEILWKDTTPSVNFSLPRGS